MIVPFLLAPLLARLLLRTLAGHRFFTGLFLWLLSRHRFLARHGLLAGFGHWLGLLAGFWHGLLIRTLAGLVLRFLLRFLARFFFRLLAGFLLRLRFSLHRSGHADHELGRARLVGLRRAGLRRSPVVLRLGEVGHLVAGDQLVLTGAEVIFRDRLRRSGGVFQ